MSTAPGVGPAAGVLQATAPTRFGEEGGHLSGRVCLSQECELRFFFLATKLSN